MHRSAVSNEFAPATDRDWDEEEDGQPGNQHYICQTSLTGQDVTRYFGARLHSQECDADRNEGVPRKQRVPEPTRSVRSEDLQHETPDRGS
jgi:CBS domain containing-hemolysin-like protein